MLKTKSARSAGLIREALDLLDEGLLLYDAKDRLHLANRTVEALCGIDTGQLVGRKVEATYERLQALAEAPSELEALEPHLADPAEGVSFVLGLAGERRLAFRARPVLEGDRVVGRLWQLRDLATSRTASSAPVEVRKLESLGVLAGGIAHDFNNLLASILGHTELGLEDAEPESEVAEALESIARVAERASQLTQQMLAYAGKGTVLVEPLDISRVVREVIDLLSVSLPPGVERELLLTDDLPPIIADAVQIRQVVMNLVLNAAEALEGSGTIRISTGTHAVDRSEILAASAAPETEPGDYVYVEVADSGSGMDEATLERIYDPFFSTKFTGRGLGLAAVHGIVRGHRGLVRVDSRPGQGTTFTVDLPYGYVADSTTAPDPP